MVAINEMDEELGSSIKDEEMKRLSVVSEEKSPPKI